jgi:WD40 repeat protein
MEKKNFIALLLSSSLALAVNAQEPPAHPKTPSQTVDVAEVLHPKRDSFETRQEFQQRRQQLLTAFNQAAQKHNSHYQAGIAHLDKEGYDIDSGTFPVRLEWQNWAKALSLPEKGIILAKRDDAKAMWQEGVQKPVFVYIKIVGQELKAKGQVLLGINQDWSIHALPSTLHTTLKPHEHGKLSVAFSPNGRLLAVGSYDHTIKIWDQETGQLHRTLKGHQDEVLTVAFSPDNQWLASGSLDQTVKLWQVSTGNLISTLKGHNERVSSVTFAPHDHILASASQDGLVKIWGGKKFDKALYTLKGYGGPDYVAAILFSPDGHLLASTNSDNTVKLWEMGSGKLLKTLQGHQDSLLAIAFNPDGTLLASSSRDQSIKLWQVATGKVQHTLKGHKGSIDALSFNPDGRSLASGGADKVITLWDISSGNSLTVLEGHESGITSVAFSPNKHLLASASYDNTIKLWD